MRITPHLVLRYLAASGRPRPRTLRLPLPPGTGASGGTLLLDGFWQATWELSRQGKRVVLRVESFTRLSAQDQEMITAEGAGLLAFIAPDAVDNDIHIAPPT